MKYNIAIIGGGIIGSAIAYFLARSGRAGAVAVLEPDSEYRLATTPNGAGGIRQLFSQPENIRMSQYSLSFYKDFAQTMAVNGRNPNINFNQRGYLFVVGENGAKQLAANLQRQVAEGVQAELLEPPTLKSRFPSLNIDDVALACLSPTDGTITTAAALQGFRNKAENLGVDYIEGRVTAVQLHNNHVKAVTLDNHDLIQADVFVNAAGAWAAEVAAMVGIELPVVPMCRVKHYWKNPGNIENLPLIKDESGLFFRPQGEGFVGGRPSWEIKPGFIFDKDGENLTSYFSGYFERVVRPLLIKRVSEFSTVHCEQTWTGHYAQNTLDGNMILGVGGATAVNFFLACGFSGHGVMHAPAVGLALSELILDGHYTTMDLKHMSYQRVLENKPYREQGII